MTNIFKNYMGALDRQIERKRHMGWIEIEFPADHVPTKGDKQFIAAMKRDGEWGDPMWRGDRELVTTGEALSRSAAPPDGYVRADPKELDGV